MSETIFHRDYHLVEEFGQWVAYKSKNYKKVGSHRNERPRGRQDPTDIERVVLGATTLEEAKAALNQKLKRKRLPKYVPDHKNQLRIE